LDDVHYGIAIGGRGFATETLADVLDGRSIALMPTPRTKSAADKMTGIRPWFAR